MARNQVDQVLINRLASEIGTLKAQLAEAQLYNEILVRENERLQKELSENKEDEKGEVTADVIEEGE